LNIRVVPEHSGIGVSKVGVPPDHTSAV